jgi:hypothetical protein
MMTSVMMVEIANRAESQPWPSLDWASWIYEQADKKTADLAIACVQREKRRHFHLTE